MKCWGASWGRRELDSEREGWLSGLMRYDLTSTEPAMIMSDCGPAKATVHFELHVQENVWVLFWVLMSLWFGYWLAWSIWKRFETKGKAKSGLVAAIGHTPLVKLSKSCPSKGAEVWAKLEYSSPGGSVKDRIAFAMIEAAEDRGEISPGTTTVVEATSGNTGIGVAMACAAKGYRCVLTMPRIPTMMERFMLCRMLGAEICLSDPKQATAGTVRLAEEIASSTPNSYLLRQFESDANWRAHYETTGPEIWDQTDGRVTHIVVGCGTAGTLLGCTRYLKRKNPFVKSICVEAAESRVVAGLDTAKPVNHGLLGISPGFHPPLLPKDDPSLARIIDQFAAVPSSVGAAFAHKLAVTEGLMLGPSSGAAAKAALDLAATLSEDDVVVVIFPSSADRYLQHPYFDKIREEAQKKLPVKIFANTEQWRKI